MHVERWNGIEQKIGKVTICLVVCVIEQYRNVIAFVCNKLSYGSLI